MSFEKRKLLKNLSNNKELLMSLLFFLNTFGYNYFMIKKIISKTISHWIPLVQGQPAL